MWHNYVMFLKVRIIIWSAGKLINSIKNSKENDTHQVAPLKRKFLVSIISWTFHCLWGHFFKYFNCMYDANLRNYLLYFHRIIILKVSCSCKLAGSLLEIKLICISVEIGKVEKASIYNTSKHANNGLFKIHNADALICSHSVCNFELCT